MTFWKVKVEIDDITDLYPCYKCHVFKVIDDLRISSNYSEAIMICKDVEECESMGGDKYGQ